MSMLWKQFFSVNTLVVRQENKLAAHSKDNTPVIASTRNRVGNPSIYGSNLSSRHANKRCSCVDRRVRRLTRRDHYRVQIHSQVLDGKGPIGGEARGNILDAGVTRIKRRLG